MTTMKKSFTGPISKQEEMQSYSNGLCQPGEWHRVDVKNGYLNITISTPRKKGGVSGPTSAG